MLFCLSQNTLQLHCNFCQSVLNVNFAEIHQCIKVDFVFIFEIWLFPFKDLLPDWYSKTFSPCMIYIFLFNVHFEKHWSNLSFGSSVWEHCYERFVALYVEMWPVTSTSNNHWDHFVHGSCFWQAFSAGISNFYRATWMLVVSLNNECSQSQLTSSSDNRIGRNNLELLPTMFFIYPTCICLFGQIFKTIAYYSKIQQKPAPINLYRNYLKSLVLCFSINSN